MRFPSIAALAASAALSACTSTSTTDPDATICEGDFPLTGALTTTVTGSSLACGNAQGASLFWSEGFLGPGPETSVSIAPTTPLTASQTGSLTATITIASSSPDGGTDSDWVTPANACNLTITNNTSDPDPTGIQPNRYVINGSGTCSQPAAADATSPATGTITIGAFTFSGFIDPT